MDIIKPVDGPTPWVNAAVVVPKPDCDIRLCLEMRLANRAILCGRYLIPTVEEILQGLNGLTVFSKLDLNWGCHQLELAPECRDMTMSATHKGHFCYKRLPCGLSSASEQYQYEISTALAGIPMVANISYYIITHAADQRTHD